MVKSVKLQFRQCHSNKYTGLFLCISSGPPPDSLKVGIYRFSVNLNISVHLVHAGSHIHVNMNMKMSRWLSDTRLPYVVMCVNPSSISVCGGTCMIAPYGRIVTQYVGIAVLHRSYLSTSSYSPTHCQVPLTSSLQMSRENAGPWWEG